MGEQTTLTDGYSEVCLQKKKKWVKVRGRIGHRRRKKSRLASDPPAGFSEPVSP